MLRRTYASKDRHGQPIVALPQREVIVQRVAFSPAEQEFYAQLLQRTRAVFNEFVLQGIVKSRYAMILSLLLSLRQACDHPFLLLGRAQGLLRRKDEEELEKAITTDFVDKIYDAAFSDRRCVEEYAREVMREVKEKGSLSRLQCPVGVSGVCEKKICCEEIKLHPVFTKCLHVFCENCIDKLAKHTGVGVDAIFPD